MLSAELFPSALRQRSRDKTSKIIPSGSSRRPASNAAYRGPACGRSCSAPPIRIHAAAPEQRAPMSAAETVPYVPQVLPAVQALPSHAVQERWCRVQAPLPAPLPQNARRGAHVSPSPRAALSVPKTAMPKRRPLQTRTPIGDDTRKFRACQHEFQIACEIIFARKRILCTGQPVTRCTNGLRALSAFAVHRRPSSPKEALINSAPPSRCLFPACSSSASPPQSNALRPVCLLDRTEKLHRSDALYLISDSLIILHSILEIQEVQNKIRY